MNVELDLEKNGGADVRQIAVHNFVEDSYNCSEAVVAAFSIANVEMTPLIAAARPFGGGIAGKGRTCGALSGAMMTMGFLGEKYGISRSTRREMIEGLYDDFAAQFGTTECSILSAHDCNSPSSSEFNLNHCAPFLRFAADRVESVRTLPV